MSTSVHPVDEVLPPGKLTALGLQHVLVMYAGAVAVPLIVGRALIREVGPGFNVQPGQRVATDARPTGLPSGLPVYLSAGSADPWIPVAAFAETRLRRGN